MTVFFGAGQVILPVCAIFKTLPGVMVCLYAQDCWTALISAAKEGHIEVVKELLENNANPEHRDMVGTLFLLL